MMYPFAHSGRQLFALIWRVLNVNRGHSGGDIRASVQLVVFLLLAVALGGGILSLLRQPTLVDIEIQLPTATPLPEIKVFVNGAVLRPGVYRVDPEERLEDVLAMAGGLTQDADPSMVNTALRVSDEAHFYIPSLGEATPESTPTPGVININTATVEELQTLQGIGEQKAGDIVHYREENGPFSRVEDLLKVRGIGSKTLEDLRPLITVG